MAEYYASISCMLRLAHLTIGDRASYQCCLYMNVINIFGYIFKKSHEIQIDTRFLSYEFRTTLQDNVI